MACRQPMRAEEGFGLGRAQTTGSRLLNYRTWLGQWGTQGRLELDSRSVNFVEEIKCNTTAGSRAVGSPGAKGGVTIATLETPDATPMVQPLSGLSAATWRVEGCV